ncbi:hypothetical protein L596_020282 [Steinernema carpocapsae]|uniref:Uncharacterized protein n=1 Tax=Steinernema carpocapsae TaxID=34508 RepID=A0A4U5MT21_STECR|nr:hypothetical protein L596_020282 [Steinernema carpocapsae]
MDVEQMNLNLENGGAAPEAANELGAPVELLPEHQNGGETNAAAAESNNNHDGEFEAAAAVCLIGEVTLGFKSAGITSPGRSGANDLRNVLRRG